MRDTSGEGEIDEEGRFFFSFVFFLFCFFFILFFFLFCFFFYFVFFCFFLFCFVFFIISYLFQYCSFFFKNSSRDAIQDMILNLFKIVILHSFEEEKTGWKVIKKTLAFLHPFAIRAVINSAWVAR